MSDDRDWFQVVAEQRCEECELAAAAVPQDRLGADILEEGAQWADLLTAADANVLRRRPEAEVWSALEYAAHVRDVLALFAQRIDVALRASEPDLPWWDHEAAAVEERYNEQEPARVAEALRLGAERLHLTLPRPGDATWRRGATRRGRERFTVEGLARFALHEAHHHRVDAERSVSE